MSNPGWLLKDSPALQLVLNTSLQCEYMSDAWRRRLDPALAAQRVIAAEALFDFATVPVLEAQFRALAADGLPITDQPVGIFLANGLLPVRMGAWLARSSEQQAPVIMVAGTDVSKFRTAVAEIAELQMKYELILGAAGEGIHGLDLDGNITFSNQRAEAILGWHTEEVIGKSSHALHHHSYTNGVHYPREDCPIYATLKDSKPRTVDSEVFWHVDGRPIAVEYTSTPILQNGVAVGAVVVFRDITERKALESEKEAAFEQIENLKTQLELERDYLRDEINTSANFGEIVGQSNALKRSLAQIESVANTPVSVLVLGESGVGKEMVARAIHSQSDRAEKPLVKVNCASIPKDLFESEFFGHVQGAFTGAHRDRVGRLQLADGGTLFLDEVGEIPISQQAKLLRALQEGEFERVGDDRTMKVNVRIVAATNRDLIEEIKAGRFREDLYYRISVFPVEVPPLRERKEDIAPLAMHFLASICKELGREPMRISQNQLAILKRHSWPGNIREFKNVMERAVISSPGKKLMLDNALPGVADADVSAKLERSDKVQSVSLQPGEYLSAQEFKQLEKANIAAALAAANWKVWGPSGAAELLGMKPSTLAYRMKVLGLDKL
ncbi:MAG: sigma 54-interacting transcriptional regulator [Pseudomonadales bacterium]|nr:sigma 54-interacting transcriptional regulator [Pseudomonadales bacterium]